MRVGYDLRYIENADFLTRGIGRYAFSLLENMLAADTEVHFRLLVSPAGRDNLPLSITQHPRVTLALSPMPPGVSRRGLVQQCLELPLRLARETVDLWHFPFSEIAPPWLMRPMIVTLHDLWPVVHLPRYSGLRQKVYVELQRQIFRRATAVISISAFSQRDLQRFVPLAATKQAIIRHGINRDLFYPEGGPQARHCLERRFKVAGPYFVCLGGFDPRKNIARLLGLIASLRLENGLPHRLLLAGALTRDSVSLFQAVAHHGLHDAVSFLDYVPDDVLRSLLSGATALLFPSSYEGFGMPVLEALACGIPVIAFNNTSLPEVMGQVGILIPDGDFGLFAAAMQRVALSAAAGDRRLDADQAEAHLRQFSWEEAARQTLAVYEQALQT